MATSLDMYVNDLNRIQKTRGKPPLDLAKKEDRTFVKQELEFASSDERVSQDGELGREEIMRRLRFLYTAKNQLERLECKYTSNSLS